ncbi:MAG: FixH family protein [Flavobacteriaceae bacterium]
MKLNWGTGIVIAFIAFICFIMFFVLKATLDDSIEHSLVTSDYYKQELNFQQEIDAEQNAIVDRVRPTVTKIADGIQIVFPNPPESGEFKGTVFLYRPSNDRLDFEMPLLLSNGRFTIPQNRLVAGRWNLKIAWEYANKPYLFKKNITY